MMWKTVETRYLLLKGVDTGIWSFAKGHTDVKDLCPLDTAVREVEEETGLRVEKDYKITKHSVRFGKNLYWTAEVKHTLCPRITLNPREHSTYLWLTLEEIREVDASKVNRDIREWLRTLIPSIFSF